jgi:glycosyl transferase family 54 (putative N-acetylglucosaminyltransferase)
MTRLLRDSRLVIGVPTVPRRRDYLAGALGSLVAGIPEEARDRVAVVVLNAAVPPSSHPAVAEAAARHRALVDAGLLTFIDNPAGHPALAQPAAGRRPGERPERFAWRRKLVLDFAHLARICSRRGDVYLHVEDDTLAAPDLVPELTRWYDARYAARDDWLFLALFSGRVLPDGAEFPLAQYYSTCAILFRAAEAARVADEVERRSGERPLDELLRELAAAEGRKVYVRSPSLFQHLGLQSSYAGETRPAQSGSFREPRRAALARGAGDLAEVLRHHPGDLPRFLRKRAEALWPWLDPPVRRYLRPAWAALRRWWRGDPR